MKRGRNFLALLLCSFACVVLFSAMAGPVVAEVSITGTVYADDWDDKGNVTLVVIETADGEIYYVSGDAKGKWRCQGEGAVQTRRKERKG